MAPKFDPASIWRNVKEIDLQRIRQEGEKELLLAVAGAGPDGMQALADNLRSDPRRPDAQTHTPVPIYALQDSDVAPAADLILLLATQLPELQERQAALLAEWGRMGQKVVVIFNPDIPLDESGAAVTKTGAGAFPHAFASPYDWEQLHAVLAPKIYAQLETDALALGRRYPLMRETVARRLILDTSNANAAYSFSTGLAEIVPILGIPLNVADIIVLTKAQALLVYKLGLALGLSTEWQYYVGEFSGVIGSGFLWRQVARSLVGLIPAWGIVPKVAVAYSGTYAVGQAVLHWYLTGRHVSRKMLSGFMREALGRGKAVAKALRKRLPSRRGGTRALPAGEIVLEPGPVAETRICPDCATHNDPDASFCKSCGEALPD